MRERQLDSEFHPERNKEATGVSIRIEKPEIIFKSLESGSFGEICYEFMENPIQEVGVNVYSSKDSFDLVARAKLSENFDSGKVLAAMLDQYSDCYQERGKTFVIPYHDNNFVVTLRSGNILWISSGTAERYFTPEEGAGKRGPNYSVASVIPSPALTKEQFQSTMTDFSEFLEKTYGEIYAVFGKASNSKQMTIAPTKEMVNKFNENQTNSFEDGILKTLLIEKPKITFADVGGQAEAKKEIESIAFAFKNPSLYKKWGTKFPKGVLLYGPPGTGKTLMAKALASQADARFLYIQASDVTSKWYGESEKLVAQIFSEVKNSKENTILFIDEVDALMPNRNGQTHEATNRMMSVFLQNIDGLNSSDNVIVVASTNRPQDIDPAFLRSGRFDRQINVPLPDNEGITQILQIHIDQSEKKANRILFDHIDTNQIIDKLQGMSGADIAEIIRRVLEVKLRIEGTTGQDPGMVDTSDIENELASFEHKSTKPKRSIGFLTPAA